MTDFFENPDATIKKVGGTVNICSTKVSLVNNDSKKYSLPNSKTLQENLKDLKSEIVKLEKNIKTPFNKKAFQIHANKSNSKGIIHRFPTSPAYGIKHNETVSASVAHEIDECNTPTSKKYSNIIINPNRREPDQTMYTLIDAKDSYVREKQKEIYEANEEFRTLMVEAEKIKKDENQLKLKRINDHHRAYEKRLEEAKKQHDMQLCMLQQQLRDNIEGEEAVCRNKLKQKIVQLEQSSVFHKVDSAYYAKLTPSKIDKLYSTQVNTPYKQEKEDYVTLKSNLQNSYGMIKKNNQLGIDNSHSTTLLKGSGNSSSNHQKILFTSPNQNVISPRTETRYKTNNLFDQTRSCRNQDQEDYIDNIFYTKSPSFAQSKLEKLKTDIQTLQRSNQKRFLQNSDSQKKSLKSANYSPISKDFLMKSRKKKCRDDIDLSSSSEDEQKFIKDYKKYKENVVLKEKLRIKQSQEFWESTQKK